MEFHKYNYNEPTQFFYCVGAPYSEEEIKRTNKSRIKEYNKSLSKFEKRYNKWKSEKATWDQMLKLEADKEAQKEAQKEIKKLKKQLKELENESNKT